MLDTRLRNYSHSVVTKIIVFAIVIACFTGAIVEFINIESNNTDIFQGHNYYESAQFMRDTSDILNTLTEWVASIDKDNTIVQGTEDTYSYQYNQRLDKYKGLVYYAVYKDKVLTNGDKTDREYFRSFPAYILADGSNIEAFPQEIEKNSMYHMIPAVISGISGTDAKVYVAFTDDFLKPRMEKWKEDKANAMRDAYGLLVFTIGLMVSFIYLAAVAGKNSFKDNEIHMNIIDSVYNDIKILLCLGLIMLWFTIAQALGIHFVFPELIPITIFIAVPGLVLVLSLVKNIKNGTLIKNSLIYNIVLKIYQILKKAFDNGNIGVKTLLIIIAYSILVSVTNYLSAVVIAVGAWYALRKVEAFSAVRKGVERIKNGDLSYKIELEGEGEFKKLADDINRIADGLNEAVKDAVKSERLKTELITNVSHDIRTPLTSIITYVDLLKNEEDQSKAKEYVEIIDQKAQRLKSLTDDLFEASKASSGDIPVNYEKIDIVSLMKQGLGEVHDKVEESGLDFKMNTPGDKVYIKADGKLLWRAIENLLSNIFKYALKGSRVYVDIEDAGDKVSLALKNISAYELNVSPDELMERFKRGDESRSSQGSGLGLSIAKSLVEIQGGSFGIEIDGDLFKAIIRMPKYKD